MCSLCRKGIEGRAQASTSAAVHHHDPFPTVEITELSSNTSSSDEVSDTTSRMDESSGFLAPNADIGALNQTLAILGETPIQKRKATASVNYAQQKMRKIQTTVQRTVEAATGRSVTPDSEQEMLTQVKEKFRSCTKNSERAQVLTVSPKCWSVQKLATKFIPQIIWPRNPNGSWRNLASYRHQNPKSENR